jgi:hypothetical protein
MKSFVVETRVEFTVQAETADDAVVEVEGALCNLTAKRDGAGITDLSIGFDGEPEELDEEEQVEDPDNYCPECGVPIGDDHLSGCEEAEEHD